MRARSVLAAALAPLLAAAAAAAAPSDPAAALESLAAPPLVRRAPVALCTPETLWERIDGEAELYRGYGVAASAHAVLEDPQRPDDRRVEVSVFSFADPLGAFGIYASFLPPGCEAPLGSAGCVEDFLGFFWQGDLFVLADAAGPDATRAADLRRVLEAAAALLGPAPAAPAGLRHFAQFTEKGSVRYQPRHLLGRAALPPGLEGTARGTTVLMSDGARGAEAAAVLESYAAALEKPTGGERDGARWLAGRDPVLGPVTLLCGRRGIVGARAPADAPGLWQLLEALGAESPAR